MLRKGVADLTQRNIVILHPVSSYVHPFNVCMHLWSLPALMSLFPPALIWREWIGNLIHHEGNFPFCTLLPHMPDRITSILTLVTLVWVQFHLQGRVSWPHHGRYCPRHCYGEPRRHRRVGCRKATSVLRVSFHQDPEPAQPAGEWGDRHWELEKWDGDPCGQSWTNWG